MICVRRNVRLQWGRGQIVCGPSAPFGSELLGLALKKKCFPPGLVLSCRLLLLSLAWCWGTGYSILSNLLWYICGPSAPFGSRLLGLAVKKWYWGWHPGAHKVGTVMQNTFAFFRMVLRNRLFGTSKPSFFAPHALPQNTGGKWIRSQTQFLCLCSSPHKLSIIRAIVPVHISFSFTAFWFLWVHCQFNNEIQLYTSPA